MDQDDDSAADDSTDDGYAVATNDVPDTENIGMDEDDDSSAAARMGSSSDEAADSMQSNSDDDSTRDIIVACCRQDPAPLTEHVQSRGGRQLRPPAGADVVLPGKTIGQRMNSSEATIVAYITSERITQKGATRLLKLVRDPAFNALDIRSSSWNNWIARLYTMSAHGLHTAYLAVPAHDGTQAVDFVHRGAWDVIKEFIHNPDFANQMIWGFQPEFDAAGERVYGEIMSSRWIESVYADLEDTDVTIVAIVLGSDAFKTVQLQKDGHPFYMTLGNLPTAERARRRAWILMGFMPKLIQLEMETPSDFNFRRRIRQIFQGCVLNLLKECTDIWNAGGRKVQDPSGVWRKIMPILCLYNTDRQEHEMVTMAHVHTCFHCGCPPHYEGEPDELPGLAPFDVDSLREAAMCAALTGVYSEEDCPRTPNLAQCRAHHNVTNHSVAYNDVILQNCAT